MVLVQKSFPMVTHMLVISVGGKCHGNGKLVISSKEYMGGMFVNGKLNGNGYIFQNGILYTDNFYEGVANGYGTIVYSDRTSWSGIVLNGLPTTAVKTLKKVSYVFMF
ncbi:unnamed protein product [Adineta steineri]|uniref:Uncharacterized protein n=1 Tax=Adineta steineri TaxID=433720 RepID=A0A815F5C3_9BILA|nr:unnamed protein product [Adineta steineri]CAF3561006.1 unnamed protein product [Adineta steineri]